MLPLCFRNVFQYLLRPYSILKNAGFVSFKGSQECFPFRIILVGNLIVIFRIFAIFAVLIDTYSVIQKLTIPISEHIPSTISFVPRNLNAFIIASFTSFQPLRTAAGISSSRATTVRFVRQGREGNWSKRNCFWFIFWHALGCARSICHIVASYHRCLECIIYKLCTDSIHNTHAHHQVGINIGIIGTSINANWIPTNSLELLLWTKQITPLLSQYFSASVSRNVHILESFLSESARSRCC